MHKVTDDFDAGERGKGLTRNGKVKQNGIYFSPNRGDFVRNLIIHNIKHEKMTKRSGFKSYQHLKNERSNFQWNIYFKGATQTEGR